YDYVRRLVSGRYALMLLMSFGAWIFESIVLFGVAGLYAIPFTTETFSNYISSILSANHSALMRIYTFLSIVLIAVFMIVVSLVILFSKTEKSGKNNCTKADNKKLRKNGDKI
ncbi:MAG TPA: hypothetical protein PLU43_05960, partial [Lachnospiraceae bacterium]|nr:hypothetical protein [Lachnospiraceae bacterium]